jgi:RNase P/RNase MRP subunit p30
MIDFVFPKGNEKDFIVMAERLGISQLYFVYDRIVDISNFQKDTKVKLSQAVVCAPQDVKKYKGRYITVVSAPADQSTLRHIIEKEKPDILLNLEFGGRKDFLHHRASGLNHVLAVIAREKDVSVGFGFSSVLNANPKERAIVIGRMMQNIVFAHKFKFNVVLASFAREPWHMRPERELAAFFINLGMTFSEARSGMEGLEK